MNKSQFNFFKKAVVWSLIFTLLDPAMVAPAFARDTDIYLAVTTGTTTAEPNVLFILGTNDRMNIPEPWREYTDNSTTGSISSGSNILTVAAGATYAVGNSLAITGAGVNGATLTALITAISGTTVTLSTVASTTVASAYVSFYDSHVEYLWNDINIISNTEVPAESASAISDVVAPVNPFSPWGTWSGTLITDRQNLWHAVQLYANANDVEGSVTDPGPRYVFRNYFNDYSWIYWLPAGTPTTDIRLSSVSFNRFRAGPSNYTSGTRGGIVYPPTAPTSPYNYAAINSGFATYNLCAQTNTAATSPLIPSTVMAPTSAPQNAGVWTNQQWIRWDPYLNLATVGNSGYPGSSSVYNTYYQGYLDSSFSPPTNGFVVPPASSGSYSGPPYRDSLNSTTAVSTGATGLPIRIQRTAVTSPTTAPDGLHSYAGWSNVAADLGGYTFVPSALNGLGATGYPYSCTLAGATCTAAGNYAVLQTVLGWYGVTNELGSSWPLTAFYGNRDSTPTFDMQTGAAGYYDTTSTCNPTSGPTATGTCIGIAFGGTAAQNATWTQLCKYTAGYSEYDASATIRTSGGTCAFNGSPTCSDPRTSGGGYVAPHLVCGDFSPPASCSSPTAQTTFYQNYLSSSCTTSGVSTTTVSTCTWSGRQAVYIEGQGYYYYGGTCQETGGGSASTSSCTASGSSLTLNGTSEPNVYGPVTTAQYTAGTYANTDCTNAITAGNYTYGGTCAGGTQYQVSTSSARAIYPPGMTVDPRTVMTPNQCAFSGGTALTIRGNAQTFNRSCSATSNNTGCTARYGGAQCDNSSTVTSTSTAVCPTQTTTSTVIAATGANTYDYQAYKLNATQVNLYHECVSDGPLGLNASSSYPTSFMRTFATAANTSATAVANTQLTDAYVTTAAPTAQRFVADATKNIDVYSVNYLNWRFGAKACRDSSGNLITSGNIPTTATCNPIGRKTRLQISKDALSSIVQTTNGIRAGLEVFNKTDTSLNSNGGNIAYAIRRMGSNSSDTPAYNNRASLVNAIQGVVASSRSPLTEAVFEAYNYFSGRAPVFGTLSTTAESGGTVSAGYDTSVCTNSDSTPNTVCLLNSGGTYNSPMMNNPTVASPAGCQKNFIILVTNGQPEDDYAANASVKNMQWRNTALNKTVATQTNADSNWPNGTDYNQIPATPGGVPYGPQDLASTAYDGGYVWLDELTYFMSNADVSPGAPNFVGESTTDLITGRQSVNAYTIGFAGVSSPVLQDAAQTANGNFYVANDAQELSQALTLALVSILSWNPTEAAVTIPLDNLNRGQSSNNVFLAFFGPSPQETWPGTLKKFELGTNAQACGSGISLCFVGQTELSSGNYNIADTDPTTGQTVIDPTATSFWGPSTLQDGPLANKGGTGYQLIANTPAYTPDTRVVYTFLTNGVSNRTALNISGNSTSDINRVHPNNSTITAAMVGAANANTRAALINYILGGSPGDANCTSAGNPCTTWATWPHFDIQHSKPAVVTYDGTQSPPVQEIFYVQDNGMLTAVDANTGQEQWSFLIEEALPQLSALQANVNGPEIYVSDGSPIVFYDDENGDGIINGNDRVWLFFGLRRGGRVYYALDITNKDQPQFKWKITANGVTSSSGTHAEVCMGSATCSPNSLFDQLGETWSTPVVGPIQALGAATGYIPALIFAGGYDLLEDAMPWVGDPVTQKDDMGRALYVINANTTQVIQSWGVGQSGSYLVGGTSNQITTFAIPSDVTALNTTGSPQGFLDRVYVGDLGGNVWRFDIGDSTPSTWKGEHLAALSKDTPGINDYRKFFFPPAVAPQSISGSSATPILYDAVYIGSGDTEHPLCLSAASSLANPCPAFTAPDKIFMLMDDPSLDTAGGTPNSAGPAGDTSIPIKCCSVGTTTLASLSDSNVDGTTATVLSGDQGWYRGLDDGEKVANSPSVFFNVLDFGTYAPLGQNNSCTPPGQGRLNQIDALYGALENLNGGSISATSRYFSSVQSQGYISTGQLIVVNTNTSSTSSSTSCTAGSTGCVCDTDGTNCVTGQVCTAGSPGCVCDAGGRCTVNTSCGRSIYRIQISGDGTPIPVLAGTICSVTKVYWYMEPEQ